MAAKKREAVKPMLAWAGFVNGTPFMAFSDNYEFGNRMRGEFFRSKVAASKRYQDVRLVEIREVEPKRRRK